MSKPKSKTNANTEQESAVPVQNNELFSDTNITMKSGHLLTDAVIVGEGKYVKLRFASNKQFASTDGEIKTNTNFFNALVSYHLKEAFDLAKDLKKGDWIYLKGEDSTKSFDTPEGFKQTACTIFAYHVVLKKPKNSESTHPPAIMEVVPS
jgi:single-stranded DNA-binding protein